MTDRSAACEAIGHDWRTSEASGQVECQRCGLAVPLGVPISSPLAVGAGQTGETMTVEWLID